MSQSFLSYPVIIHHYGLFFKFMKIKAIKIYENIDILENYSNNKNENNVA